MFHAREARHLDGLDLAGLLHEEQKLEALVTRTYLKLQKK
jgi:hypothetical protein